MLLRRKATYYYDAETCTYKKHEFRITRFIRQWSMFLTICTVVGTGAAFLYRGELRAYKMRGITAEHKVLSAEMAKADSTFARLESSLDEVFKRSRGLYIPIAGIADIPEEVWSGAMGGSSIYNMAGISASQKAEVRLERLRYKINLLTKTLDEVRIKAEGKDLELKNIPSIKPVRGAFISGFGYRNHPVTGGSHLHTGLDFACQIGTPVYATGDGKVIWAEGRDNGYGIHIDIDHGNGFETKYAHLSRVSVAAGQNVKRGDIIGYSGNTGLSSGPHLHYEIAVRGVKIDPIDYFYGDITPTEYVEKALASQAMDFVETGGHQPASPADHHD